MIQKPLISRGFYTNKFSITKTLNKRGIVWGATQPGTLRTISSAREFGLFRGHELLITHT
jgi:hypothetical protein